MNKQLEYFADPRMSNSKLGLILSPPFAKKVFDGDVEDEDEKKHFRIGSALDAMLTDWESWERDYIVLSSYRPSGMMEKFINNLPHGLTIDSDIESLQQILCDCKNIGLALSSKNNKVYVVAIYDKIF